MSLTTLLALKLGPVIAKFLARLLLGGSGLPLDLSSGAIDLATERLRGRLDAAPDLDRQLKTIGESFARDLAVLGEPRSGMTDASAWEPVLLAVERTVGTASLPLLVHHNLRADRLAATLLEGSSAVTYDLSTDETALHNRIVREISKRVVGIASRFPGFGEAVASETLDRIDSLVRQQDRAAREQQQMAERLAQLAEGLAQIIDGLDSRATDEAETDLDQLRERLAARSRALLTWQTTVPGGHRIETVAERQVLDTLATERTATILLLGPKGSGKSALSAVVGNEAILQGCTVLAIKADLLAGWVVAPNDLQRWLELPVSVTDAIRLLSRQGKVLLLIDQLDSVSELVDRKSDRLNLLLDLINALSGTPNVYILASCREFDYRHDSRLSTIVATELHLELPSWEMVAPVLRSAGYDPDSISDTTRELLRTPWHLSLFLKGAPAAVNLTTLQSLIDGVWQRSVLNADGAPGRVDLLERIAKRMSDEEELFVPAALADADGPRAARDALLHDEILAADEDGRVLRFRHQTFYDYTLARAFARGDQSLADHVLERQDGLFVRPTMLSGLELLRDASRGTYHRQLNKILNSNPRRHIRTLLLEFLGQQKDPDDLEAGILLEALRTEDGPLVLRAAAGSPGWFERLRNTEELVSWLQRPPDEAALSLQFLTAALGFDACGVYWLISRYWLPDPQYDRLAHSVAHHVHVWDEQWVELLDHIARRSEVDILWTTELVADSQPELAPRLVRAQLDRELVKAAEQAAEAPDDPGEDDPVRAYISSRRENPFVALIETDRSGLGSLPEIAAKTPRAFVEAVWPWFIEVLQRVSQDSLGESTYREDWATSMAYELRELPLIESLHAAADGWAQTDPDGFARFATTAAETDLLAAHRILAQAFTALAAVEPQVAFAYLLGDRRRLTIGTHRNQHHFSEALITAVVPHLGDEARRQLEEVLASFDLYADRYRELPAEERLQFRKWSREHRLRLLRAIPDEKLSERIRRLKAEEENLLPCTRSLDSEMRGGWVGPRVTSDEMARSRDDDILNLVSELEQRERSGQIDRWDFGVERGGGSREQAQALGNLAEQQPERVIRLLGRFEPDQWKGDLYVGCAVSGLAKSSLATSELLSLIQQLEERGFGSETFREHAASAIEQRAQKEEPISDEVARRLEVWIEETETPIWPEPQDTSSSSRYEGPLVFGRGGGAMFLTSGRGTIARAIATIYAAREPVDAPSLIRVLRSRIGAEKHPQVFAEMLFYMRACFTRGVEAATAAYDAAIQDCPALLESEFALQTLAYLTGYVRPPEIYHQWLEQLAIGEGAKQRHAYGELLFLYYARRLQPWADERIEAALAGDVSVLRGLTYGAREAWYEPHCRSRAADILCAAARSDDPELPKILEFAFIPPTEERFPVDAHTRRVVEAACANPAVLQAVGSQLVEALAPSAGTHPSLALEASRAIVDQLGTDIPHISNPLNAAAGSLTSIAITLHRLPNYRQDGLRLFEDLIRLGVSDAIAALDLIDRKPNRSVFPSRRRARRRRR
jgi:hypothetical protein